MPLPRQVFDRVRLEERLVELAALAVEAAREPVPAHPPLGDVDSPRALEDYQEAKPIYKAEWAKVGLA